VTQEEDLGICTNLIKFWESPISPFPKAPKFLSFKSLLTTVFDNLIRAAGCAKPALNIFYQSVYTKTLFVTVFFTVTVLFRGWNW
jgi:hypothetical protein